MKHIEIYTDGACSGNPGPGGWGAILRFRTGEKVYEKEISGGEAGTTNNRMELTAAIEGLKALKEPCDVTVYTDSAYLAHAFQKGWLKSWTAHNWLKSDKKPVENRDLWEQLLSLGQTHRLTFVKVRGHSTNALNNRCDELATGAIKQKG